MGSKPGRFGPGAPVRTVMTKWGDRPHWVFPGIYLGADQHGDWIGIPARTRFSRPGSDYVSPVDQVSLVPADGAGWLSTFHAFGGPVRVYVDLTSTARWDGPTLRAIDLDLDVVLGVDGAVWVDDEDEFAEHTAGFGYPGEVVERVRATCDLLQDLLRAGQAPFDGAAAGFWLQRLAERQSAGNR